MNTNEIKIKLKNALESLEESDDIVITTTSSNYVVEEIYKEILNDIEYSLVDEEYKAVTNALNVLINDVKLNENDFQTIIGLDKKELTDVLDKLLKFSNQRISKEYDDLLMKKFIYLILFMHTVAIANGEKNSNEQGNDSREVFLTRDQLKSRGLNTTQAMIAVKLSFPFPNEGDSYKQVLSEIEKQKHYDLIKKTDDLLIIQGYIKNRDTKKLDPIISGEYHFKDGKYIKGPVIKEFSDDSDVKYHGKKIDN